MSAIAEEDREMKKIALFFCERQLSSVCQIWFSRDHIETENLFQPLKQTGSFDATLAELYEWKCWNEMNEMKSRGWEDNRRALLQYILIFER